MKYILHSADEFEIFDDLKFKNHINECKIISKTDFNNYRDRTPDKCVVLGRIRIKDFADEKYDGDTVSIGSDDKVWKLHTNKYFDKKAIKSEKVLGYGVINENQYVMVTKEKNRKTKILNGILVLVAILLMVTLSVLFSTGTFDGKQEDKSHISVLENGETTKKETPLCYYIPLNEKTEISKEQPYLSLVNVKENDGNYYVSYKIFINEEEQFIKYSDENTIIFANEGEEGALPETKPITPGSQVLLDLYSSLDKGEYRLSIVAMDYDYRAIKGLEKKKNIAQEEYDTILNNAKYPMTHSFDTNVIVE